MSKRIMIQIAMTVRDETARGIVQCARELHEVLAQAAADASGAPVASNIHVHVDDQCLGSGEGYATRVRVADDAADEAGPSSRVERAGEPVPSSRWN